MDCTSVLAKNDGFTVRVMGDETLFLDSDGTAIHVADEVGSFIYGQIDGEKNLGTVLEAITETYDIDGKTAEKDMLRFCGELVSQHILGALR